MAIIEIVKIYEAKGYDKNKRDLHRHVSKSKALSNKDKARIHNIIRRA